MKEKCKPSEEDEEAPFIESSRKPEMKDLGSILVEVFECATCAFLCTAFAAYVACFVILGMNTNESVFNECGMYWYYILISLLSPLCMPLIYCICICNVPAWDAFVLAYTIVFASTGFLLNVSVSKECISSMRQSTPPIPCLYFLGWIKCTLYLAGTISSVLKHLNNQRPNFIQRLQ